MAAARERQARALLKTPPLPAERNELMGSWRLGDDQRPKVGGLGVVSGRAGLGAPGRGQAGAAGALQVNVERLGARQRPAAH